MVARTKDTQEGRAMKDFSWLFEMIQLPCMVDTIPAEIRGAAVAAQSGDQLARFAIADWCEEWFDRSPELDQSIAWLRS